MSDHPFNPLDIDNLGQSIERAILESSPTNLNEVPVFRGAGVYAIYYTGPLGIYQLLSAANKDDKFQQPIYVGKSVPEGGRKGVAVADSSTTRTLSSRIRQHKKSVASACNLQVEDFHARWLVVEPVWIPLGESILIGRFAPVWNTVVDGFGSNAAGSGRFAGMRSRWDTLHPGRPAGERLSPRHESANSIGLDVQEYLRQRLQV